MTSVVGRVPGVLPDVHPGEEGPETIYFWTIVAEEEDEVLGSDRSRSSSVGDAPSSGGLDRREEGEMRRSRLDKEQRGKMEGERERSTRTSSMT